MQNLLNILLKSKINSLLNNSKKDKILFVFVGNNKIFYDNFSFYVLRYLKESLKATNKKCFLCYAKNGIYGNNYIKLLRHIKSFNGLVVFIDSAICKSSEKLGVIKVLKGKVQSLADFYKIEDKTVCLNPDCISVLYFSLAINTGQAINEQIKKRAAKNISNIFCQCLAGHSG